MKQEIVAHYAGGMSFNIDVQGYKIVVDATPESGGNNAGPTPKPLLLASLAGCTGIDVVALLQKMHVKYDSLDIKVEGELAEDYPKKYVKIHVVYSFTGEGIDRDKVDKAIILSKDKYCGVSATLMPTVELTYEIKINQ